MRSVPRKRGRRDWFDEFGKSLTIAMTQTTLTRRGRLTLPQAVRDTLGLRAGDRIGFAETEHSYLLVPVRQDLRALRGMFKGRRKKPATLAEMKAAITELGSEHTLAFHNAARRCARGS